MKPIPSISSRRNFLRRSLFGGAFGLTAKTGLAQEASVRITPEQKQTGQHQHNSTPADETDPIRKALQRPVTTLKGFDPARYLTNYDYGRESKLPDGRVLREFDLTAQDMSLEVAPGIFFPAWTFNGTVPGPTLRCRQGELVRIHFSNQPDHARCVALYHRRDVQSEGKSDREAANGCGARGDPPDYLFCSDVSG